MAEFIPASMPALTKAGILGVRHWNQIPDNVSDEDALSQGLITPELLMVVMQIVQDLMQNCLSNNAPRAWTRIRGYIDSKEASRLGDSIRLNWTIDRWMIKLATPRETGDVVAVRRALIQMADSLTPDEFKALQTEILFLTV